ncbi:hypothetical protein TWF696_008539 [Orbilia brochopaga]|uniref:Major facilitator superfamily (MFS) profile domain-containing protein n=1 Tax=Orbilia brochopaga TaxID=3140254 RepID=A0AAV9UHB8_9PEZI
MLCIFFALASFVFGYNIGIIGTVYVNKGYKHDLHNPSAEQKGLITGIYYIGAWISFVFISGPLNDRIGRRWASFVGCLIVFVGSAVQISSHGPAALALMMSGRLISGTGTSIIATTVPLYQSEITPASQRGRFVIMNHVGFVVGLAVAFWVGYAFSFWDTGRGTYLAWRVSMGLQYIPALAFMLGVPFVPESPRWLLDHNRAEEARRAMAWIRGTTDPDKVQPEIDVISENIRYHREHDIRSWKVLFTDELLFARLWRAALLQFLAMMSGATAIKYYLPTNFKALGLPTKLALLAGGIDSTLKIGCTLIAMTLIDKLGRRKSLMLGAAIMAVSLFINAILPQIYPNNTNWSANLACIVFIFIYTFGNGIGYGPTAWVYGSEIFPTHVRAKGLCIAASGSSIGSVIVTQIWPVGIHNIGSKTYYIFFAFNAVSILLIYLYYPETKGKSLEELDALFVKKESFRQEEEAESAQPLVQEVEEDDDQVKVTAGDGEEVR